MTRCMCMSLLSFCCFLAGSACPRLCVDCKRILASVKRRYSSSFGLLCAFPVFFCLSVLCCRLSCFLVGSDGLQAELLLAYGRYILEGGHVVEQFDALYGQTLYKQLYESWMAKWSCPDRVTGDLYLSECIVAFAATHSVFTSSALAVLQGDEITYTAHDFVNALSVIASSRRVDIEYACALFSRLEVRCDESRVLDIVAEAVDIEKVMFTGWFGLLSR